MAGLQSFRFLNGPREAEASTDRVKCAGPYSSAGHVQRLVRVLVKAQCCYLLVYFLEISLEYRDREKYLPV